MTSFVIEGYDNLRIIHAPTGMIYNHYSNPLPPKCFIAIFREIHEGIMDRATFIFVMKNSQMDYKTQPLID